MGICIALHLGVALDDLRKFYMYLVSLVRSIHGFIVNVFEVLWYYQSRALSARKEHLKNRVINQSWQN